ncbi:hypothetical protein K2173_004330 [Erythroxylum novogranatense]|uniref:Receptor-like serine/threonine-protein kinase n=1 Tax=Erythroxylum novogranatense TaxID=1862640 RepID=A0AAV8T5B7_9ROSI|nr:hypothetical protein K2173_004330 [Erythroxylum novogranatense]
MFLKSCILMLLFTFCSSRDTISMNQRLKDGEVLISNEGKFVLGFFTPGNSNSRYLGIWYQKVPGQIVVWIANRDSPLNDSTGVLSLNKYGNLVLNGSSEPEATLWSTNVTAEASDSRVAQLLDTGNLAVVHNVSKEIVWQSFDHPTDTLLPGMKVGMNRKTGMQWFIISRKSADNPGTGEFIYKLNPNGAPQFFLYQGSKPYWRSAPRPWKNNLSSEHNYTYVINQDEIYESYALVDQSIVTRFVLDPSGTVKRTIWASRENLWQEYWSAPMYRCERYGECGAYGKCSPNIDSFECTCLPGYEPRYPSEWSKRDGSGGCVRKRLNKSSVCGNGEGFVKVTPLKIPDSSVGSWVSMSMSRIDCENVCLANCSCTAYSSVDFGSKGTACLAWYGDLVDTMENEDESYDLYVRVDATELAEYSRSKSILHKKGMMAILVSSIAVPIAVIIVAYCMWLQKKRKKKGALLYLKHIITPNALVERSHSDLPLFKINSIFAATDRFAPANKLGEGGFGSVYRGQLPNGQEIAVKRLAKSSGQGIEEFKNEVTLIAKLQHRNLVKLLGCCIEGAEQMLIYEYLRNKSLDFFLFDQTRQVLEWRKRLGIIVGIARGILYLHRDSRLRIIHRDLKTSNILLDEEMNPKISDFGMARIFQGNQVQDRTTRVVGTYGYMSPEYVVFGKYSIKSDVYSFGVIVLEVISGMRNNGSYQDALALTLMGHVWELWREGRALEVVDSFIRDSYIPEEVLRCIQIGLLCVQVDAEDRPTISEVLRMLNRETALPYPKEPAFVSRKSCSSYSNSQEAEGVCSVNEITQSVVDAR